MKGPGMPPIAALLMVAAGAIVAACGGSAGGSGPSQTTSAGVPTSSSTSLSTSQAASTAAASPSPDPASQAVIRAYEAANRAFVHAISIPDPNDPALVATMTGDQLSTVKKNLIIDKASGIVGRGDILPTHPHVISDDGSTAVVQDCAQTNLGLFFVGTGAPAPGIASGAAPITGTRATLVRVDGTWKLALSDLKVGTCPPGY